MKKLIITSLLVTMALTCGLLDLAYANNIRVENVEIYKSSNQPTGTIDIKFDVFWDNSYGQPNADPKDANNQSFYDRAWIFVKFWSDGFSANSAWGHATLITGGTLSTYSSTTGTGISADGMGAFAAPGTSQTVRWNYAADTISSGATITPRIMAVEMVRIPEGAFWVGSGGTEVGSFTNGSWGSGATIPLKITSQGVVTIAQSAGSLWGTSSSGTSTIGPAGDTNADFPNGCNAFYLMKYEITEKQYVDFLNTLKRQQQQNRIWTVINMTTTPVDNIYVMANTSGPTLANNYNSRNTINCSSATSPVSPQAIPINVPITFYTMRPHRACNYLSWMDLVAYADWAGLRPITELEFEKAARGRKSVNDVATENVVANEYAWGSASITKATAISGAEGGAETITTAGANCCYGNATFSGGDGLKGPLRTGIFAKSGTSRVLSGAGYYGNMELSGNIWEKLVTIGNVTGRSFTGLHGNGYLTTSADPDGNGNADVAFWPGKTDAAGSGFRGGAWSEDATLARVSDRLNAANASATRTSSSGGRLVRTSP